MVPKQPTNQPTDRRAGHNQPTNKLRRVSENDRKLKKRFRFQLSPCEKQSCSLLCHCKAVRNTLTNTQVPQTSKTRPHARNNWGTWRGHNNQLEQHHLLPCCLASARCKGVYRKWSLLTAACCQKRSWRASQMWVSAESRSGELLAPG